MLTSQCVLRFNVVYLDRTYITRKQLKFAETGANHSVSWDPLQYRKK